MVVCGSLAHDAWLTLGSDGDLPAGEIPPDRVYATMGAIAELSEDVPNFS